MAVPRAQNADEKAALAESAKQLKEAERAYQPASVPITDEIKKQRIARQQKEAQEQAAKDAAKQAKTPSANVFGEVAQKAEELSKKPEPHIAATPVAQLKQLAPKDKQKLSKVEIALNTEETLEKSDANTPLSTEVLTFDEALKRYNDSPSRNYYNQDAKSRYELIEHYRAWLKTFREGEQKAGLDPKTNGYEALLNNFSNAQKALRQANAATPSVPVDITNAQGALQKAQAELNVYESKYPELARAHLLAMNAQERIQRPQQNLASLEKAVEDPDTPDEQKSLYSTLVLIEKAERRIARLDNKQQLAEATIEDKIASWKLDWQAKQSDVSTKEFVTYGKELEGVHANLVNNVLKPAVENNQKLKQELYELGQDLETVKRAITLQKQVQENERSWYDRNFGDEPESLRTLKAAEERITTQFKRIKAEIEASEQTLQELFKEANKPLNEGYHDFIKKYIIDYKSWSTSKKAVALSTAGVATAGVMGAFASTSLFGAATLGGGAVASSLGIAAGVAAVGFPPSLLLLIPAAAAVVIYKSPRWIVNLGDKWNAWRENPFSSEADKEEFLIARVAGTSALTRTVSKEKNEQGEQDILNICMYISKWSSKEDIRKQVEQFLGECMFNGLVETDPETGEKTLHITNIPKAKYIETRAALVVLAGRFNIKLTGPAFDQVEDIQNVEEYKAALTDAQVNWLGAIDNKYKEEHPNAPGMSDPETFKNVVNAEVLLPQMMAGNNSDGRDQARSDLYQANEKAKEEEVEEKAKNTAATGGIAGVERPVVNGGPASSKIKSSYGSSLKNLPAPSGPGGRPR